MDWQPPHINDHFGMECYKRKFFPLPEPDFKPTDGKKKIKPSPKERNDEQLDTIFVFFLVSIVCLLISCLAVGSYSGEGKPPMYGDFEAQRHWMEITVNLPVHQWYINSTDNNLQYWGLDYPPLTAYHSWIMGYIAKKINPSWVELHSSRGIETRPHKLFMRITAAVGVIFFYVPILLTVLITSLKKNSSQYFILSAGILYAGLLAIDGGHFQYNSISLGLFLAAYLALERGRMCWGSLFFVMAINYKQMELYHSLPIFVFILGRSMKRPVVERLTEIFRTLFWVSMTVLSAFGLIWLPFIYQGLSHIEMVLRRIFPFYRGLYEDKVASIWCAFSFVLKLNKLFSQENQIRLSTICVLAACLPSLVILFRRPSDRNFRISLFICSISFFLFSFQVHEKSILLPAISCILLLAEFPLMSSWFLNISNISMFSLCLKDNNPSHLLMFLTYDVVCLGLSPTDSSEPKIPLRKPLRAISSIAAIVIGLLEWFCPAPANLPHIFPLLNAAYSCCHFIGFLLYFYFVMISEEWQKTTVGKKKQ